MTSPDRIGFRRLQKWVRIWSINKDCEFLGIIVNFKQANVNVNSRRFGIIMHDTILNCEFLRIVRGLTYLTSFYNNMLWFLCNFFTGYKDNYAKQAGKGRLKPMISWPMEILNHYPPTLHYVILRPYKFSKRKFSTKRNEAK